MSAACSNRAAFSTGPTWQAFYRSWFNPTTRILHKNAQNMEVAYVKDHWNKLRWYPQQPDHTLIHSTCCRPLQQNTKRLIPETRCSIKALKLFREPGQTQFLQHLSQPEPGSENLFRNPVPATAEPPGTRNPQSHTETLDRKFPFSYCCWGIPFQVSRLQCQLHTIQPHIPAPFQTIYCRPLNFPSSTLPLCHQAVSLAHPKVPGYGSDRSKERKEATRTGSLWGTFTLSESSIVSAISSSSPSWAKSSS